MTTLHKYMYKVHKFMYFLHKMNGNDGCPCVNFEKFKICAAEIELHTYYIYILYIL